MSAIDLDAVELFKTLINNTYLDQQSFFFQRYIYIDLNLKQIQCNGRNFSRIFSQEQLVNPNYIEQLHFEVNNSTLMIKQSLYSTLIIKLLMDCFDFTSG